MTDTFHKKSRLPVRSHRRASFPDLGQSTRYTAEAKCEEDQGPTQHLPDNQSIMPLIDQRIQSALTVTTSTILGITGCPGAFPVFDASCCLFSCLCFNWVYSWDHTCADWHSPQNWWGHLRVVLVNHDIFYYVRGLGESGL
jgi:hypothetical protein